MRPAPAPPALPASAPAPRQSAAPPWRSARSPPRPDRLSRAPTKVVSTPSSPASGPPAPKTRRHSSRAASVARSSPWLAATVLHRAEDHRGGNGQLGQRGRQAAHAAQRPRDRRQDLVRAVGGDQPAHGAAAAERRRPRSSGAAPRGPPSRSARAPGAGSSFNAVLDLPADEIDRAHQHAIGAALAAAPARRCRCAPHRSRRTVGIDGVDRPSPGVAWSTAGVMPRFA